MKEYIKYLTLKFERKSQDLAELIPKRVRGAKASWDGPYKNGERTLNIDYNGNFSDILSEVTDHEYTIVVQGRKEKPKTIQTDEESNSTHNLEDKLEKSVGESQ